MRESVEVLVFGGILFASGVASAQTDDEYYDEEAAGDYDEAAAGGADAAGEVSGEVGGAVSLGGDDEEDADEGDDAAADDPDAQTLQARRDREVRPGINGEVGLLHIAVLDSGPPNSFRVGLHTEFFSTTDFLALGDSHDHIGATLGIGYTPIRYVETYLSLASYANHNTTEDPQLFQVLGDTIFGAKGYYPLLPWWSAGGDFGVYLLNQVGNIGVDAASFGIRGLTSMDFQRLGDVPIRTHLNLGYYFDNSANLVESTEDARTIDAGEEREISRQERYALGINRTDQFQIGLGVDVPLDYVMPFVEWNIGIPVNRTGYDCLEGGEGAGGIDAVDPDTGDPVDSCLAVDAFPAFPDRLTLGARILPPIAGLGIDVGADIGLTGVSTHVKELAATPPYMIHFGVTYNYDTRERVRTVTKTVTQTVQAPAPPPPPPKGRIRGRVRDAESGSGIAAAVVSFPGRELTALASSTDGAFVSYELDPGEVQLHVVAQEYFEGDCAGTLPEAGGDVEVDCQLRPTPKLGSVRGRVSDENAAPVAGASISITGVASFNMNSGPDGGFDQAEMPPGAYTLKVEREGYMVRLRNFTIEPRGRADVDLVIRSVPRRPSVTIRGEVIRISKQVRFQTDSADLHPDSASLLDEVANVMLTNPQIRRVEIQGHTDNTGGRDRNQTLSQSRAESVRTYLIGVGVASERLEAKGYGQERPIGPNITGGQRARNRRVEFHITDQGAAAD